jgi:Glyoxalase superfamily protein/Clp amino terminal domain, pathogenicity island component
MRDFRDAKAMAYTLRAALAAKGLKITVSQSLELIAQAFGVADWNTLAAAIRRETQASPSRHSTAETAPARLSPELISTLTRALGYANQRKHEYTTLEHLLLALIDDLHASGVMKACDVDLGALRENVARYIDNDLKTLVIEDSRKPRPTPAFRRVMERAVVHAQGLSRETATGGDLLVAIFDEAESPAVWFLGEQQMTQQDAVNFIHYGLS